MEKVNNLVCDGEYVWIGTEAGLVRLHKKTGTKEYYTAKNAKLPGEKIWTLGFYCLR